VDEVLFGEAPSRIIVSVAPADQARFAQIVGEWAVPVTVLGRVGGEALVMTLEGGHRRVTVAMDALAEAFEEGLTRALAGPTEASRS
jgi:phosphoribosylformylglycinamidine synthase